MTTPAIKVFQIHFQADQLAALDPAFVPYDNSAENDPVLEFGVFRRVLNEGLADGADLWGAVSWKFGQKTGMAGQALIELIERNPGFDVYHCNVYPHLEALYPNLWLQGNTTHPGFLALAQSVLALGGLDPALCRQLYPSKAFSSVNFMVGTPAFWRSYVGFVESVLGPALAPGQPLREQLLSPHADPKGLHAGACYLPFVVERLFGVFLASEAGAHLRVMKYPVAAAERRLNLHLIRLREMKDTAWTTRSRWLADCWQNYRNLYLSQVRGPEWANQHLAAISQHPIEFGSCALA